MGIIINKPLENLQVEGILRSSKLSRSRAIQRSVWINR